MLRTTVMVVRGSMYVRNSLSNTARLTESRCLTHRYARLAAMYLAYSSFETFPEPYVMDELASSRRWAVKLVSASNSFT
jgi:hypothetical protein